MNFLHVLSSTRAGFGMLFLCCLAAMIIIDYYLGDKAEFFNAFALVGSFLETLLNVELNIPNQYIFQQQQLGKWAMPFAFVILIAIHSLLAMLIQKILHLL